MIKVIGLLKRRPDLSVAAFRDYYERQHRRIGEKHLAGFAVRYVRRFLEPSSLPEGAPFGEDGDFDVLLEVWYPDEETHARASAHLAQPDVAAEIAADEDKLFDRGRNRFFTVVEHESQLPDPQPR